MIDFPEGSPENDHETIVFGPTLIDDDIVEGTEEIIVTAMIVSPRSKVAFVGGGLFRNTSVFIMDNGEFCVKGTW